MASNNKLANRFMTGFRWSLIGNICFRFLTAISTIWVARILGPIEFGKFGLIRSTINLFLVVAGFRLGSTAVKYIAEYKKKDKFKAAKILKFTLNTSLMLCGIVSFIFYLISPYIANEKIGYPDLTISLQLGSVLLFFSSYNLMRESVIVGFENFRSIAMINIVKGILTIVLCSLFAFFYGVNGVLLAMIIVSLVSMILLKYTVMKEQKIANFPKIKGLIILFKEQHQILWKFALPGVLVGLINVSVIWFGKVILCSQERGFMEIGMFEAANQFRTIILFLPAVLTRVSLPILSETYSQDSKMDFKKIFRLQLQTVHSITLPLTIIVIGFSSLLMSIYGKEYTQSGEIISVLMISVFLNSLNQSLRQVYDSANKRWINFFMYGVWAIAFYISARFIISIYGALGLAICYLVSESFLFLCQAIYIEISIAHGVIKNFLIKFLVSLILIAFTFFINYYIKENIKYIYIIIILTLALVSVSHNLWTKKIRQR